MHMCKWEEVIPRIEEKVDRIESKLDGALKIKYIITGSILTISFLCGLVISIVELFFK